MSPSSKRTPSPAKAFARSNIADELSTPTVSEASEESVQLPGELAGAAAEIDDPAARNRLHEGRRSQNGRVRSALKRSY